eukprot:1319638-Amphidinium_carterae.1
MSPAQCTRTFSREPTPFVPSLLPRVPQVLSTSLGTGGNCEKRHASQARHLELLTVCCRARHCGLLGSHGSQMDQWHVQTGKQKADTNCRLKS